MFSATALLRCLSMYHFAMAFYLLTGPAVLAEQNLVVILGAAMDLPPAPVSLLHPSTSNGLAAIFLALLALTDFTATSMPEEIASVYWQGQASIRLVVLFGLTAISYLCNPGALAAIASTDPSSTTNITQWKLVICNSAVFAWAFVEMISWFWVRICIQD